MNGTPEKHSFSSPQEKRAARGAGADDGGAGGLWWKAKTRTLNTLFDFSRRHHWYGEVGRKLTFSLTRLRARSKGHVDDRKARSAHQLNEPRNTRIKLPKFSWIYNPGNEYNNVRLFLLKSPYFIFVGWHVNMQDEIVGIHYCNIKPRRTRSDSIWLFWIVSCS